MQTLDDYVDFIARSMNVHLDTEELAKVTKWLIRNEKYTELLNELEQIIMMADDR